MYARHVLLCAMQLGVAALASIPASAGDGHWSLASSFPCDAWDIAVDSQHNVYAMADGTIRVFTAEGQFLREKTGLDFAMGIDIDQKDVIYVVNYFHEGYLGWVARYDTSFQELGGWPYAHSDLEMGFGIDVSDGIAYVAAIHGVLKFATDGTLLDTFPGYMRVVDVAADGSIWCGNPDNYYGIVRHYSPEGEVLAEWSTNLGEKVSGPDDIAVDSNQRVFVADGNVGVIKIFRPNGKLDDAIPVWTHSVALDGDDVLWVGGSYPTQLMKFVSAPLQVEPATWGRMKAAFVE